MDPYLHIGFDPMPSAEKLTISPCPKFLRGFSFVFAADFHIRRSTKESHLEALTELIRSQSADMLLLGGDYGEDAGSTKRLFEHIAPLKFKYGTYACIGNNDKEAFGFDMEGLRQALGVPLLLNEYVRVPVGNGILTIAGADERKYPLDLPKKRIPAVSKRPSYTILLSHYPQLPKLGIGASADLVLSGHTHGGQMNFFGLTPYSFVSTKNLIGHRTINGKRIITCPGIGVSKLPIRLGVKPKIYVVDFK